MKKILCTIRYPNLCVAKSFWVELFFLTHFALHPYLKFNCMWLNVIMSTQVNFKHEKPEFKSSQDKVKVTDLLSRLNEEKKIEKKRNLALGVAAVSAVTVFGIILTI